LLLVAALVLVATMTIGSAENLAPAAGFPAPRVIGAESPLPGAVPRQYQIEVRAISRRIGLSIIDWNCCRIGAQISNQNAGGADPDGNPRAKEGQYQPVSGGDEADELMLRVGGVLGLGYLAFLAIWIWATRLRPH
jgi:hypothetical protein